MKTIFVSGNFKFLPAVTDKRVKKVDLKFQTKANTKRKHKGSKHIFTKSTNNYAREK